MEPSLLAASAGSPPQRYFQELWMGLELPFAKTRSVMGELDTGHVPWKPAGHQSILILKYHQCNSESAVILLRSPPITPITCAVYMGSSHTVP